MDAREDDVTVEFEAVDKPWRWGEKLPDGRRRYALVNYGAALHLWPSFERPVEIHFGQTEETSPCFLMSAKYCPQLGAEYILLQPDVVQADPTRGWAPLGGRHPRDVMIGREDSPQFRLGPDVSGTHCDIAINEGYLLLDDVSRNGTVVMVAEGDVREELPDRPIT